MAPARKEKSKAPTLDVSRNSESQDVVQPAFDTSGIKNQAPSADDKLRQNVSIGFVIGYFSIIFLALIYCGIRNYEYNETKDMVLVLAGLLNTPLGIVIAYYFRASRTDN